MKRVLLLSLLIASFVGSQAVLTEIALHTSDCEDCGMLFAGTVSLKVEKYVFFPCIEVHGFFERVGGTT